jgi:hypothetical protein
VKRATKVVLLVTVMALAATAAAWGAGAFTATSTAVINACQFKNLGTIRIVTDPAKCNTNLETAISWNVVGAPGPQGPAGPKGDTGAKGETGAAGAPGTAGATGSAGPAGAKGDTGAAGKDGTNGTDGAAGPPGPKGEAGAAGADGLAGATGDTGAPGPAGADGEKGDTGPQGPKGDTGPAGPQGATGPAGAAGNVTFYEKTGTLGFSGIDVATIPKWGTFSVRCGSNQIFLSFTPLGSYNYDSAFGLNGFNTPNTVSGSIVDYGFHRTLEYSVVGNVSGASCSVALTVGAN